MWHFWFKAITEKKTVRDCWPCIFSWIENQCQGYVNSKYKHRGLINQQTIGTVKHIKIKKNEVRIIYLELDDKCAGQTRMSESDITAKIINGFPLKEKRLTHISQ